MLLELKSLLSLEDLAQVGDILARARFVDGARSAGSHAAKVKRNAELSIRDELLPELNGIVMGRLVSHPEYQAACLPHRVAAPFYARYTPGCHYGAHIDDPIMGEGQRYRSDISVTIFLNSPDSYRGGELCIMTANGEQKIKLEAGAAVLYPSSSLHRVAEVTDGTRLVAVTWIQSLVRDASKRELLYNLAKARRNLSGNGSDPETARLVDHSYVNLVRMWSDI